MVTKAAALAVLVVSWPLLSSHAQLKGRLAGPKARAGLEGFLGKAEGALQAGKPREARKFLNLSIELYRAHREPLGKEGLTRYPMQRARQIVFEGKLVEVNHALAKKDFDRASELLNEARHLGDKAKMQGLDQTLKPLSSAIFEGKLLEVSRALSKNDFTRAEKLLKEASHLGVEARRENLRNELQPHAAALFEGKLLQAKRTLGRKDFKRAKKLLNEARDVSSDADIRDYYDRLRPLEMAVEKGQKQQEAKKELASTVRRLVEGDLYVLGQRTTWDPHVTTRRTAFENIARIKELYGVLEKPVPKQVQTWERQAHRNAGHAYKLSARLALDKGKEQPYNYGYGNVNDAEYSLRDALEHFGKSGKTPARALSEIVAMKTEELAPLRRKVDRQHREALESTWTSHAGSRREKAERTIIAAKEAHERGDLLGAKKLLVEASANLKAYRSQIQTGLSTGYEAAKPTGWYRRKQREMTKEWREIWRKVDNQENHELLQGLKRVDADVAAAKNTREGQPLLERASTTLAGIRQQYEQHGLEVPKAVTDRIQLVRTKTQELGRKNVNWNAILTKHDLQGD